MKRAFVFKPKSFLFSLSVKRSSFAKEATESYPFYNSCKSYVFVPNDSLLLSRDCICLGSIGVNGNEKDGFGLLKNYEIFKFYYDAFVFWNSSVNL